MRKDDWDDVRFDFAFNWDDSLNGVTGWTKNSALLAEYVRLCPHFTEQLIDWAFYLWCQPPDQPAEEDEDWELDPAWEANWEEYWQRYLKAVS